jgi:hypothetical protein
LQNSWRGLVSPPMFNMSITPHPSMSSHAVVRYLDWQLDRYGRRPLSVSHSVALTARLKNGSARRLSGFRSPDRALPVTR